MKTTTPYYVIQQVADVTFRVGAGHETKGRAVLAAADVAASIDEETDVFVDGPDEDTDALF